MAWPEYVPENELRYPFANRPTKGKTARKRKFPPRGNKTNVPLSIQKKKGK